MVHGVLLLDYLVLWRTKSCICLTWQYLGAQGPAKKDVAHMESPNPNIGHFFTPAPKIQKICGRLGFPM